MADGANYTLKGFDEYEILLGDQLRGERATMGKSLLDVQRDLKIKASYIAAIENCDLEVFSNKGFIAGYVRSYARYLNLEPEAVYNQFCSESGFSNGNNNLNFQITKSEKNVQKKFGPVSNWKPGEIGQVLEKNNTLISLISNSAPAFVLLLVIIGTSFGAISILREVQKLDVVALEEAPDEMVEILAVDKNKLISDSKLEIYSSEELALPVFEPRDKVVSRLEPNLLTALEDTNLRQPTPYKGKLEPNYEEYITEERFLAINIPDPIVRTIPDIPRVQLLAMTPAWVRVKNGDGDIILEKTLDQRETFLIEKNIFTGELRAGNAQNVYFIIDREIFGPLSLSSSVVKNVSLNPETIKQNWGRANEVTASYFNGIDGDILLNTAENIE